MKKKVISFKSSLKKFWNIKNPRIGITGINPHSGEGGLIGDEEIKLIKPVLEQLRKKSFKIYGPLSADSCFHKSCRDKFDGILCIYHDQGLIPIKTLDFDNSINVTGGLPFIRVSPDHGPNESMLGQNLSNPLSLIKAIKLDIVYNY